MLVSGMLFSCTNNNQSEEASAVDSTAIETEAAAIPVETEDLEQVEVEATAESVAADSAAVAE